MSDSSIPNPQLYELIRTLAAWYFTTFYDYTQSGLQNVPKCGPVIFAANHVSFYDPPAIGACIHRPINYFARDTLFKGLFGKALREIGTIPVARENADIKSLKAIFRALKSKGIVAIYPEGTRSMDGQLTKPKPGAGMIACKSKATVIPTRLFGTHEAFGRADNIPKIGGHIHIAYGKAMVVSEIDPGKMHPERYLEASRRIMARIEALRLPSETII